MKNLQLNIRQKENKLFVKNENLTEFEVHIEKSVGKEDYEYTDYVIEVISKQKSLETVLSVDFIFKQWDEENYVYAPAAAYNGNKFKAVALEYPPLPFEVVEKCDNPETVITDVPRLSKDYGPSKMEILVGDLTKPMVGFFSPQMKKGTFILFEQQSLPGYDNGVCIIENEDKTQATFSIVVPGVRELKYLHMHSDIPSDDRGYLFEKNESQVIKIRVYEFECASIKDYFKADFSLRKSFLPETKYENNLPFYKAFRLVEDKYNMYNWECNHGFYRSSVSDESICGQWQTGWVGGGMSTYPCFIAGNTLSKQRSLKTLEFIFSTIQVETGLMYGMFCKGEPYGDSIDPKGDKDILLLRKFTDAVYFLLKQFLVLKENHLQIPKHWIEGTKRALDVLQEIYLKNGQFGQFVDIQTTEIIVRGTSSAVIGIAALALGKVFYEKDVYLDTAKKAARYYYKEYLLKGISNGGPGEICQCIDSESSFSFLESYMTLYDITRETEWIDYARDAAHFAASWCVAYDFKFPAKSQFAQRKIKATGAVWASIQNKHAAPGICTLSGVSLFKLYRATKEHKYLELFKEISHNITQYVSTKENPLKETWGGHFNHRYNPPGFVGERINLSDWEGGENVGEFPGGSCWCEVTMMLNYVENPGVYILQDLEEIYCFDHIEGKIIERNGDYLEVVLSNHTDYDAYVTVLTESSRDRDYPLDINPWANYEKVWIEKGKEVFLRIFK